MANSNLYLQSAWSKETGILSYTIFGVSNVMMTDWSEQVITDLQNLKDNDNVRILFDLSHTNVSMSYFILTGRKLFNVGITPKGQEQFVDILEQNPNTQFKLAVLLSTTMLGALAKHVPERYEQNNFFAKVFFDANDAENWLMAQQTDDEVKTGGLPTEELEELLADLGTQDPDIFGNRRQLRLLIMGSLEVISISEDKPVIIGRGKHADLSLRDYGEIAKSVSRQHAIIALKNGRLSITDLDSSNGTTLSGRKLEGGQEAFIRRDDVIQMGLVEMTVIF